MCQEHLIESNIWERIKGVIEDVETGSERENYLHRLELFVLKYGCKFRLSDSKAEWGWNNGSEKAPTDTEKCLWVIWDPPGRRGSWELASKYYYLGGSGTKDILIVM